MRKKTGRLTIKAFFIFFFAVLFLVLLCREDAAWKKKQPKGERITAKEVRVLCGELEAAGARGPEKEKLESFWKNHREEYVSYTTYRELLSLLVDADHAKEVPLYEKKYRSDFQIIKKDWYQCYQKLLQYYGLEKVIREETIELLCSGESLLEKEEKEILLTADGEELAFVAEEASEMEYTVVSGYLHENRLLAVTEVQDQEAVVYNALILESGTGGLRYFYKGYEICSAGEQKVVGNEKAADLVFGGGQIREIRTKEELISGKLIGIEEDKLEIEGKGSFPIDSRCQGYRLYGALQNAERSELLLGYDFTDFVLDHGKICAFFITREEELSTIRVAIKNEKTGGLYHDSLTFYSDRPLLLEYGLGDEITQEVLEPSKPFEIGKDSSCLKEGRVKLSGDTNTARISLSSLQRASGEPSYAGTLEVIGTKQGLILINELPLENYLFSVVPSEMPASYPGEALKAQAICARTYAIRYLYAPGYPEYGAHVDDSVSFQVYNNLQENADTTKAVKETAGKYLCYEEEPVSTYYYSTSCGYGTDESVWSGKEEAQMPYLSAHHIAAKTEEGFTPGELQKEENFREYITKEDEMAYEKEEPWFRWTAKVEKLEVSELSDRLKERFLADPEKVLLYEGTGDPEYDGKGYVSREPGRIKSIYEIRCQKRGEGGVMEELLLETDQGTYKVLTEYNIRYILNQNCQVRRADGSLYEAAALLPSAYLIIDVVKSGKDVIGYTMIGGGYGHGVGMSQNGAKAMALSGKSCEEILSFFFPGCEQREAAPIRMD